jgi:hypothetical protein
VRHRCSRDLVGRAAVIELRSGAKPGRAVGPFGWSAVAHAASYAIYTSTSGSSGTYSLLQGGVTSNPYTTTSLGQGTYYFEIAALVGTNWPGAKSVATSPGRTIRTSGTRCA